MSMSRVIGNEICFYEKVDFEVYELFRTRYGLFKQIYSHSVSKAIEYMIGSSKLKHNNYCVIPNQFPICLHMSFQELAPARKLVDDIWKRRLYKFVAEFNVPPNKRPHFPQKVSLLL